VRLTVFDKDSGVEGSTTPVMLIVSVSPAAIALKVHLLVLPESKPVKYKAPTLIDFRADAFVQDYTYHSAAPICETMVTIAGTFPFPQKVSGLTPCSFGHLALLVILLWSASVKTGIS